MHTIHAYTTYMYTQITIDTLHTYRAFTWRTRFSDQLQHFLRVRVATIFDFSCGFENILVDSFSLENSVSLVHYLRACSMLQPAVVAVVVVAKEKQLEYVCLY